MATTPVTPQVAPIGQTQAPTMAVPASVAAPDISGLLSQIQTPTAITVPQTVTGTEATPKLAPIIQMPEQGMMPTTSGTDKDKRLARVHNTVAGVTNSLNQFMAQQQQKKQEGLKTEIATIMKAQQQIDNANAVLANDPNNANAKAVLAQNKAIINAKFSDKKTAKELQKAFDISFTDPEKNQTMEVKAMQQARKETQQATAAGLDANSPQERAVAMQSPQASTTQVLPMRGGPIPGVVTTPVTQAAPLAAAQARMGQAAPVTQPQARSATPYADQFLKQQVATIQQNPQYAAQLAQQQKQENLTTQYVIPRVLDAFTKYNLEQVRQGGLNARTEYAGTIALEKQQNDIISKSKLQDEKDKTALTIAARHNTAQLKIAEDRLNAAYGAAEAKGIKGTPLQNKIQDKAIADLTSEIGKTVKIDADLDAAISANAKSTDPRAKEHGQALVHSRDMNDLRKAELERRQQEAITRFWGVSPTEKLGSYIKGYDETPGAVTPTTPAAPPGRAAALGIQGIPRPEFDVRTGLPIPGAAVANAKQAGVDAVTTGKFQGKPVVIDKEGRAYDAGTYKYVGNVERPTADEPPAQVGADLSDSDESTDSSDAAEQAIIDKLINE